METDGYMDGPAASWEGFLHHLSSFSHIQSTVYIQHKQHSTKQKLLLTSEDIKAYMELNYPVN